MKKIDMDTILSVITNPTVKGLGRPEYVDNAKPITDANEHSLVWVSSTKRDYLTWVINTSAKIVIADRAITFPDELLKKKTFILVDNPRLEFVSVIDKLFVEEPEYLIHRSSTIHPSATIEEKVHIGPNCYIGKCVIQKNTVIHGNCYIYDNTFIGENVTINAGTVIGSEGFGYERDTKGIFHKFHHLGGVRIESFVDIGANTCIDRGTLGDTVIKYGAKIDNLVHIAHNVIVGKHSAVIANAMVGGSTTIGDYVWLAPSASVRDGIVVNRESLVGMGAVVTKNVPEGETWLGSPAMELSDYGKRQTALSKLAKGKNTDS